jgi:predicted phosphodiesterase
LPNQKEDILNRFASIIKEQGMISAAVYDSLQTEKPSRRQLYNLFGKWRDALTEAVNYLAGNGEEIRPPNQTVEQPNQILIEEAEKQVKKLQQQVQELTRHIQTPQICLEGTTHKFGLVADNHCGSLYSDYALLNYAYDVFEKEKINTVLNAGDIVDGIRMFKGHEYELEVHGADNQVNIVSERYPKRRGIITYFIRGNHDYSFHKHGGTDIGKMINTNRPDLIDIGHQEADIKVGKGEALATIRLYHPDGGTAYAISYNIQRYISELPSGTKPDILIVGHFHKAEVLYYRGVCAVQAGTTQMQTPFMRGRKISAAMGFWTMEVTIAPKRVVSMSTKFFPVRT